MLGQSKYHFPLGYVTITRFDGYAPNDADLHEVRKAMEEEAKHPQPHLRFEVGDLRVIVHIDDKKVLEQAVKPLQENKRIHP